MSIIQKSQENGTELFFKILRQFGVPISTDEYMGNQFKLNDLKKEDKKIVSNFVNHKNNIIVIGDNFYENCIKLIKMKFIVNRYQVMRWISQSELTDKHNFQNENTVAIVQLYEEKVEYKKYILGSIVNRLINGDKKVMLGVRDVNLLESAFPYDIDSVEFNFQVFKC